MSVGVEYMDLLGSSWLVGSADPKKGMDCAGVVACILTRLGLVPDVEIFNTECALDEEGRELFERVGNTWRDATEEGDVIVSRNELGEPHMSVVVRPDEKLALTAMKRAGVVALKAWGIQNVRAVYRRRS